jgi:hypothetical protein
MALYFAFFIFHDFFNNFFLLNTKLMYMHLFLAGYEN